MRPRRPLAIEGSDLLPRIFRHAMDQAMTAVDTNVLVRYLAQDEPKQAAIAVAEIEGVAAKDEAILIQAVVLCELVWVLETAHDFGTTEILGVLDQMVRTRQFEVMDKDTVWSALRITVTEGLISRIIAWGGPTSETARRRHSPSTGV